MSTNQRQAPRRRRSFAQRHHEQRELERRRDGSLGLYRAPRADARPCQDCGAPLPADSDATRLFCDRDRARRRALSYQKAARRAALEAGHVTVAAEMAELVKLLERPR